MFGVDTVARQVLHRHSDKFSSCVPVNDYAPALGYLVRFVCTFSEHSSVVRVILLQRGYGLSQIQSGVAKQNLPYDAHRPAEFAAVKYHTAVKNKNDPVVLSPEPST